MEILSALQTKQKELVQDLADAISTGNIHLIHDLLDKDGKYIIADSKLKLQETDKYGFLNWLRTLMEERNLSSANKLSYYFDQCLHCRIGNPVIIFDDGIFPIETKEPWLREKVGLMLEFEGDKISGISLCGTFLHTDNTVNSENYCQRM